MSVEKLTKWFLANRRSFPWREGKTPYKVLVSEVMLQQTVAKVVISYFERWMGAFPDFESLAKAPLSHVIKIWEGLGYYSRARRLHKAAQQIVEHYGGKLPSEKAKLEKLQGLGPYTVGAILSFAFHKKAAAVDGNVLRVMARLYAIGEDITKAKTKREITQLVESLLPEKRPFEVMEAFIELGALVCRPKPLCKSCPMKFSCKALLGGSVETYPVKPKRDKITKLNREVFLFECDGYLLVGRENNKSKLMADLYEFPYLTKEEPSTNHFLSRFQIVPKKVKEYKELSHSFTKYKAFLKPIHFVCHDRPAVENFHWMKKENLKKLPFSAGHRKILKLL